jgi:hypothetical protein
MTFHGSSYLHRYPGNRKIFLLYWESYQKTGTNPLTEEPVSTTRKRLKTDLELPMRDEYDHFLRTLIEAACV